MRDSTNQFDLQILVNDKPVHEYPHTDGYTYLEGRSGTNYSLKLVNDSYERVLFVPSVDGLSVLNGKSDWEDGYVVEPRSQVVIPGWRRDNNVTAAFVFADARDSYTNRMGNGASNVGVIGAMVFREKPNLAYIGMAAMPTVFGSPTSATGMLRGIAQNAVQKSGINSLDAVDLGLGTGWGQDTTFHTQEVKFEKRDPNFPDALIALYYDSAKGLERRGINVKATTPVAPNPFPGYAGSTGCAVPPGPITVKPYSGRRNRS